MNDVLKRRMAGAGVLLLLLIVVSLLFFRAPEPPEGELTEDGLRAYSLDLPAGQADDPVQPPPEPSAAVTAEAEPAAPDSVPGPDAASDAEETEPAALAETSPAKPARTEPVPSEPKPAPVRTEPPKPAAKPASSSPPPKPAAGGWAVQIGSFASQSNAQSVQRRLQGLGYTVFVTPIRSQSSTLYRVRVGPYASSADAKTAAARLKQQLKQDVKVVANS